MGKQRSNPQSTQSDEPQNTAGSKAPQINSVLVEMAWQVAIPFMALTLGGNWLDGTFETSPLFTIVGMILGLASVALLVKRLVERHYANTFKKEDK